MGIYLGQLPAAEIARFKAELAETLIANFCYPRFFDHRTGSLHMRPVDRTKRQDVWLYLSSFDFMSWSRIDLMSPDLQPQIERLFIQFMQRNRSFFGNQGRRRMADVRGLISSCASNVVLALRNHITGQRSGNPPFGSPRPVISWGATPLSGRASLTWEHISSSSVMLQQQLQEVRGELRTAHAGDGRSPAQVATVGVRRSASARPQPVAFPAPVGGSVSSPEFDSIITQQPTVPTPPVGQRPAAQVVERNAAFVAPAPETPMVPARRSEPLPAPQGQPAVVRRPDPVGVSADAPAPVLARQSGTLVAPVEPGISSRRSEQLAAAVSTLAAPPVPATPMKGNGTAVLPDNGTGPSRAMPAPGTSTKGLAATSAPRDGLSVGDDDVAIFEQMRLQLVLWLRLEAVTAGLDISNQSPAQLLEMLRQQSRHDETRLQVVSTLLNLANQVIKTGTVSALDYKQALLFHLMHTRRA